MRRNSNTFTLFFVAVAGVASAACQSGGVGDPCLPEDEYSKDFPGYQPNESNVESQSFQCETRVCLVAYFRGRVSCPYGQKDRADPTNQCFVPGTEATDQNRINVTVDSWVGPGAIGAPNGRKADQAVYCSCRCDGDDPGARYCDCPSGFVCTKVLPQVIPGKSAGLLGSYCVKEGTQVSDPSKLQNATGCQPGACGDAQPYGLQKK